MVRRRALTLAEAADRLGVKPQRINQMLKAGTLTGPDVGTGRARRGIPRVWESSLEREAQRRAAAAEGGRQRPRKVSKRSVRTRPAEASAILIMKIRLDTAREALRLERQASRRLTRQLADAVAEIAAAQAQSDRLDEIADAYSESLAQLGTPDDPSGISGRA